jgi:hypothetical protein
MLSLSTHLAVEFGEAVARAPDAAGIVRALALLRDRALFSIARSCAERAGEAGKLRDDCFLFDPDSGAVGIDYEATQRGADLTAHGRGKKQARRKITRAYEVPRHDDPRMDAGSILRGYLRAMHEHGYLQPRESGAPVYIFPVVSATGAGFDNKPCSAGVVTARLQKHLKALGAFDGETSHSLKRGGMMASPLSNEALARLVSLTPGTVARYRDIRR